ncbi:T9SS type A sorting domain-containing protein [Fibrobacterota bacterium]
MLDGFLLKKTALPSENKTHNSNSQILQGDWPENESGFRLDSIHFFNLLDTNNWFLNSRTIYSYDTILNEESITSFTWNQNIQDWENSTRSLTVFDESGNIKENEKYRWNSEKQLWDGIQKFVYPLYNNEGNELEAIYYGWNENDWSPRQKRDYTYDNNGRVDEFLVYNWVDSLNNWSLSGRADFIYNLPENRMEAIGYGFDTLLNDWVNDFKTDLVYNSDSSESYEYSYYEWDKDLNIWTDSSYFFTAYDVNGNVLEFLEHEIDTLTNEWYAYWKNEYIYDTNGNEIEYSGYSRKSSLDDWKPFRLIMSNYDEHENHIESLIYGWNVSENDWELAEKENYFWTGSNASVKEPGTANQKIHLSFSNSDRLLKIMVNASAPLIQVEVFDLKGKSLLQKRIKKNKNDYGIVDVSSLHEGVYAIKIDSGNLNFLKKLVIPY